MPFPRLRMLPYLVAFAILPGFTLTASISDAAEKISAEDLALFETRIRPVLVKHCYECHSKQGKQIKGGLRLDTRQAIRRGGETGPAVTPGSVADSLLMEALRYESLEMPPNKQLPDEVVADFERWIRAGAADPRDGGGGLIQREIDFDKARTHWAYQLPQPHPAPGVNSRQWPRDDVDRFVLARLESEKLSVAEDADRATLLRRLTFDLTGLPPTEAEIADFLADSSSDAAERVVDRLLDSPQFGVRWGRHWLDVARYAESNGRERNFLYPNAWRYRDYVIAAFNADKPLDVFIRQQIAGDLLEADSPLQRDENLIATGFLAIGPKSLNERNKEAFLLDVVDEQVDVTTRATMALTVSCARCHDHKFDPIPTGEYYSLAGIFRSTETLYGTRGGGNRQASRLHPLATVADKSKPTGKPTGKSTGSAAKAAQKLAQQRRKLQAELKAVNSDTKLTAKQKRRQLAVLKKQLNALRGGKAKGKKGQAQAVRVGAMGLAEGNVADIKICIRGEADNRGAEVRRGFLTILSQPDARLFVEQGSGRLDLARWITSRDNPLTARVWVNRTWQKLFGRGLVTTVDNFGASGEPPSHPELLDRLAVDFMDDDWSVKRLIRRLVLTRTYQLSGQYIEANFAVDPRNELLWRASGRRLEAEAIRDAMLLASGQLDPSPGPSSLVAKYGDDKSIGRGVTEASFQVPSRYRSVYLPIIRNAVPEALSAFDFAEPSMLVGQRDVTTVPSQALYLMNNPFVMEQAQQLAALLAKASDNEAARIESAYLRTLGRAPDAAEQQRAAAFIAEQARKAPDNAPDKAWMMFCQALFASAEFRYIE